MLAARPKPTVPRMPRLQRHQEPSANMKIPDSAEELFDKQLPAALAAKPEKARAVGSVFRFNIVGAGDWTVDLISSPPTCTRGDAGTAQCTLEISAEDFKALAGNPQVGLDLYYKSKLKLSGDPAVVSKLQALMALTA